MPGEAGGGAESREQRGETGRVDDRKRIDTEKPDRDRDRKHWDATHDPSEEFEEAALPLGDEYGRDRPRHRILTPEQRAELEAFTGRPADEVLALRENDPRAAHNRDEHGRPGWNTDRYRATDEDTARDAAGAETDRWGLDTRLGRDQDAPTVRTELSARYFGPEGLSAEQREADDAYIAAHGRDRPWLAEATHEEPEVRHILCARDRAGGHDPARHDGWRDAFDQEQRAAAAKDPAHPTDSPAYHNSVDHLRGTPPADDIGGKRQQHKPGEIASRIPDRTAWAVATVRALDHPTVKDAVASDTPPPNVRIPLEDVLGPDGHHKCEGYILDTTGFDSHREAIYNRNKWVERVRHLGQSQGIDHAQAVATVEQESANGEIPWVKPRTKPVESFEGGTCRVDFRRAKDGSGTVVSTICYNPPENETKGSP